MITKEDFEKAQQVVRDYTKQLNSNLIPNYTCVCCKTKKIKPVDGTGLKEGDIKPTEQEQGCWDEGTVEKITFGYGSRNDMRSFYIAICDECVEQLERDGLIIDVKKLRKIEHQYGL